jgi:hypothetical protein
MNFFILGITYGQRLGAWIRNRRERRVSRNIGNFSSSFHLFLSSRIVENGDVEEKVEEDVQEDV